MSSVIYFSFAWNAHKENQKIGAGKKIANNTKIRFGFATNIEQGYCRQNLMEHEFTNPDKETVIDMKDVISLFIAYTDTIMMNFSDEVVVALKMKMTSLILKR
ncbi:MAG: hypothetical protein IPM31_16980 [Anaerolineae bacterium]|nr:hypothetical protein [Anaerolineae bacterium]